MVHATDVNLESLELSGEYGLGFHTLKGEQKANNSKGQLTSEANPYWSGSITKRLGTNYGFRIFGGVQFVRFSEPAYATLKNENQILNQFGLEVLRKNSPLTRIGLFIMQQDHPLYFAKTATEFEVTKKSFVQSGIHLSMGQRRRIGLLWGMGIKGYALFPSAGGDVATEGGAGGEAYAKLGFVGPLGTLYNLKGFYQAATAPNADINFSHEVLGYCFSVTHSF